MVHGGLVDSAGHVHLAEHLERRPFERHLETVRHEAVQVVHVHGRVVRRFYRLFRGRSRLGTGGGEGKTEDSARCSGRSEQRNNAGEPRGATDVAVSRRSGAQSFAVSPR